MIGDISSIVIGIVKHLSGKHDQKDHAGSLRRALSTPIGGSMSKRSARAGTGRGERIQAVKKEIGNLPKAWQKRYEDLVKADIVEQEGKKGKYNYDTVSAEFNAAKKLAKEIEKEQAPELNFDED